MLMVARCYAPAFAYGGPVVKMEEMARYLAGEGHRVVVVTSDVIDARERTGRTEVEELASHLTLVRLRGYGRYRWETLVPRVNAALNRVAADADLAHVYGYRHQLGWSASRWAARRGIPFMLEPEGSFEPSSRSLVKKALFDRTLGRWQVGRSVAVVAESGREGEEFCRWGVPREKVAVLRNGADARSARTLPKREARARLGLPPDLPVVAWLGRLVAQKDVQLLIRAVAGLERVGLVVAGPDEDGSTERCRHLAQDLGMERRIWLPGALSADDKWVLFAAADCFALSSQKESFGIAAAEAMMAGVPVVVPDTAGVAEIVTPQLGVVVPREEAAFRSALAKCLSRRGGLDNEILAPTEHLDALSWTRRARGLVCVYEGILAGCSGRGG
ncbi:MAG: glycosyltransferase [Actinomycetota bacterium]